MAALLVLLAALAQEPSSRADSATTKMLYGKELQRAAQDGLHRWARPAAGQLEPAARELLSLYRQVTADVELPSAVRQDLSVRLRGRLNDLANLLAAGMHRPNSPPAPARVAVNHPILAQRVAGGLGPAPGGAGPQTLPTEPDAGDQLVEIIRDTIAPSTWDKRGGPGTIMLWRPGNALVIRQTDEVQDDVANLLIQLRRVGP
jgi:hypothetical protein